MILVVSYTLYVGSNPVLIIIVFQAVRCRFLLSINMRCSARQLPLGPVLILLVNDITGCLSDNFQSSCLLMVLKFTL